ncbi:MAG: hypothetical protein K2X91_13955 [Thermoleophilia bacterium]|nr:hypothetical protein [Thermoleophilia bacterium]
MTTQTITSAELLEGLTTDLEAIDFDEAAIANVGPYSATKIYSRPGAPVQVEITIEECDRPGVDDLLSVKINELDARGWATGVTHTTSHLNERNARALVAYIEALAEVVL